METYAYLAARIILGLLFFYSGLNAFFNWRPLPPVRPEMQKFGEHLMATGIIMPVVKIFEVIFGLLLLTNFYTFAAILALLPICFFIVVSHLKYNRPDGYKMALLIGLPMLILLYSHRLDLLTLLRV